MAPTPVDKARRILHYEPRVGLEEGLIKYVGWVKDCGIDTSLLADYCGKPNWLSYGKVSEK